MKRFAIAATLVLVLSVAVRAGVPESGTAFLMRLDGTVSAVDAHQRALSARKRIEAARRHLVGIYKQIAACADDGDGGCTYFLGDDVNCEPIISEILRSHGYTCLLTQGDTNGPLSISWNDVQGVSQ